MSEERFIKFIDSKESDYLQEFHPNAFLLLCLIARRARRISHQPDGLEIGEAFIGDFKKAGIESESKYRTAKKILEARKHIRISETCRNRKILTTGMTTIGTKVKLLNSGIWDINPESNDDRHDDRMTTGSRRTRMTKNEKESHHPYPSSKLTDDLSSSKKDIEIQTGIFLTPAQLDQCIAIKGSRQAVEDAIAFIMKSPKRKTKITDWVNAISTWDIKVNVTNVVKDNLEMAEKLSQAYSDFSTLTRGYRFSLYLDNLKDQRGLLIESQSPYITPTFLALIDPEFKKKVDTFMLSHEIPRLNLAKIT